MLSYVSVLVFALGLKDTPAPVGARPAGIAEVVGRLLVWCVKAGMTPDQVEHLFGRPTMMDSFTNGPIGQAYTTTWFTYLNYGVTITFPAIPEGETTGQHKVHERVQGGIE